MTDPLTIWSLFVGSLGLQAVFAGGWMRSQLITLERQRHEEEEDMVTRYEAKDAPFTKETTQTNGSNKRSTKDPRLVGWEFKIVRADRDLFRDPAVLKRLCEEEESAGWIMLEKLDDRRIRFKRPIALREIINPEMLPFDPYRTHYGSSSHARTWLAAIVGLIVLLLPAYLGYTLVSTTLLKAQPNSQKPAATQAKPAAKPAKVF